MPSCPLWTSGLLLCLLIAAGCDRAETITIAGETFTLELAVTDEQREHGMSGRESFPPGGAMLFIFPGAQVRHFWMYECLIDIDLVFLDRHGVITALHRMPTEPLRRPDETQAEYEARLPRYSSRFPAQFALEFEAGTIDRLGLQVDQRLDLDTERLKRLAE